MHLQIIDAVYKFLCKNNVHIARIPIQVDIISRCHGTLSQQKHKALTAYLLHLCGNTSVYVVTGTEAGLCAGGANLMQEAMKPHKVEITKTAAPARCIK